MLLQHVGKLKHNVHNRRGLARVFPVNQQCRKFVCNLTNNFLNNLTNTQKYKKIMH